MEKCPRCGFMADAVETIKAPKMPDAKGNRIHTLVGHVYYHSSVDQCAVPKVGEAYAICLEHVYQPVSPIRLTGTGDVPAGHLDRGTGDVAGN